MTNLLEPAIKHVLRNHPQSLVVRLESCGNPDYHQNIKAYISPPLTRPCDTFAEAVEYCRNYIGTYNLGGGNWTGGQIYHPVKGLIAYVSYNGRVWKTTTGEWEPGQEEITELDTNDY